MLKMLSNSVTICVVSFTFIFSFQSCDAVGGASGKITPGVLRGDITRILEWLCVIVYCVSPARSQRSSS